MPNSKNGEKQRGREAQTIKKIGRPRIIESPAEMERLVQEYVTKCHEEEQPLTLTGMILHLGLSSRQSLDQYGERPEFTDSVKNAKLLIENQYERELDSDKPAGAIFALKNMGWSDRREVEFKRSLATIDLNRLSDEQLLRISAGEPPWFVVGTPDGPTPALLPAASEEDVRAADGDGAGPG